MTDTHDTQQDSPAATEQIVCSACDGAGPYSEDGCVECVSTGYELTDAQWEREYSRWERRTFAEVEVDDDSEVGRRVNEYIRARQADR